YVTIEMFSMSLNEKTKLKGLLEIISSAAEFETIPIRHHEDGVLKKIYDYLPVKLGSPKFNSPHIKTNVLLQAHFSRYDLDKVPDLKSDQIIVLGKVIPLIQAIVDVISSNGWLNTALAAMELSQMCVQAIWNRDSPLKQIPYFEQEHLDRCKERGIESVADVGLLEDDEREDILRMDKEKKKAKRNAIAKFINRYPDIDVKYGVRDEDELVAGSQGVLDVKLTREDYEDDVGPVYAPRFPHKKDEGWWIVF
ncbi:4709_t:CDS:2, partial [Acaulospora morrowiae]